MNMLDEQTDISNRAKERREDKGKSKKGTQTSNSPKNESIEAMMRRQEKMLGRKK